MVRWILMIFDNRLTLVYYLFIKIFRAFILVSLLVVSLAQAATHSLHNVVDAKSIAVVLYIHQSLAPKQLQKAKLWTRKLVDLAFLNNGNYYLPYQLWPTRTQLLRGYPLFPKFVTLKRKYDLDNMFTSKFFQHYFGGS